MPVPLVKGNTQTVGLWLSLFVDGTPDIILGEVMSLRSKIYHQKVSFGVGMEWNDGVAWCVSYRIHLNFRRISTNLPSSSRECSDR